MLRREILDPRDDRLDLIGRRTGNDFFFIVDQGKQLPLTALADEPEFLHIIERK